MKKILSPGDLKIHRFRVASEHLASFNGQTIHRVCSTFKLAQEMEWSSRLFILDLIEDDEEGVGTMLHIDHKSPAFEGEEVTVMARFESLTSGELICAIEVKVNERLIALGKTGQKLMKKDKLLKIFNYRNV